MPDLRPRAPLPAAVPPAYGDAVRVGRALAAALVVVGALAAAAAGVLFFATELLPRPALPFFGLGVLAAVAAALATIWLHGRFVDPRATSRFAGDGRLLAGRLQSLLAAAFGIKLAVLVAAVFALRSAGAKFDAIATFAITFAAAALICQLATAASLARGARPRRSATP